MRWRVGRAREDGGLAAARVGAELAAVSLPGRLITLRHQLPFRHVVAIEI